MPLLREAHICAMALWLQRTTTENWTWTEKKKKQNRITTDRNNTT